MKSTKIKIFYMIFYEDNNLSFNKLSILKNSKDSYNFTFLKKMLTILIN